MRGPVMTAFRSRALLGGLVLLALLVPSLLLHPEPYELLRQSFTHPSLTDFNDPLPALEAAHNLLHAPGAPLYQVDGMDIPNRSTFLYPPIAAALYVPFVTTSPWDIVAMWSFHRTLFLVIGLLVAAALAGRPRLPKWWEAALAAGALAVYLPLIDALNLNQAQLHVTALFGAAWIALDRGADRTAGVFLGLMFAIKPHLALMLPLLSQHARRTALVALGAAAALAAASVAWAGLAPHIDYLTQVIPLSSRGYAFAGNQSIGGLLRRWMTDAPIDAFVLAPPNAGITRATLAVWAALYAGAAALVWRARRSASLRMEITALAWLVATVGAPIAWSHHYAPTLFILAWLLRRHREGVPLNAIEAAALGGSFGLMALYVDASTLDGRLERLLASHVLAGGVLLATVLAARLARGQAAQGQG